MGYNEELKNKKTWVLVIAPHRYDEKDNKPQLKMIKFNMPVPPPTFNGRKMKNNADDARLVWDELFAWKYGNRAMDINFMMNIQDLNRAIHIKVNFVSLIEKPPRQLKKEMEISNTIINGDFSKGASSWNSKKEIPPPESGNVFKYYPYSFPIETSSKENIIIPSIMATERHVPMRLDVINEGSPFIKELRKNCKSVPEIIDGIDTDIENTHKRFTYASNDGITDDTQAIQSIIDGIPSDVKVDDVVYGENLKAKYIIDNHGISGTAAGFSLNFISSDHNGDKISTNNEEVNDMIIDKLPRIKVGQRFLEDMVDKHLDPMVKKLVKVEERLTDDRFHMLRSKYVRMFDKKTLEKVPLHEPDVIKNFWWCKTYLWRTNGKGVINMGYALYSMDELYSFKRLIDEETIAIKMEIMQWNKRISNEI